MRGPIAALAVSVSRRMRTDGTHGHSLKPVKSGKTALSQAAPKCVARIGPPSQGDAHEAEKGCQKITATTPPGLGGLRAGFLSYYCRRLTPNSKAPRIWLTRRAAWAVFLIGCVIVVLRVVPDGDFFFPSRENNEAKIGVPRISEHVPVFRDTIDVELTCPFYESAGFGERDVPMENHAAESFFPGTYIRSASARCEHIGGQREVEVFWNGGGDESDPCKDSNAYRRCSAIVHEDGPKFKSQVLPTTLMNNGTGLDRNIGAQLPFGGLIGPLYQSSGAYRQIAGGQIEQQREYGEKTFAKFDSERRDFRAVLASLACAWFGWFVGMRVGVLGFLMIAYSILGLIGRFDLFSIYVMLR